MGCEKVRMRMGLSVPALILLLPVSACGGGGEGSSLMPALEGKRLDVAQSDLAEAGIPDDDIEVIGGGAFGVVDESNWDVCDQEPGPGEERSGKIRLTVDRTCDGGDSLEQNDATAASPSPDGESDPPAEEPESEKFEMPRLVGQNLQDAQDRLQSLGSYVLQQDDATGLERFQVLDSNWKVCNQKPRAGKSVPIERLVILGAVKLDERCP